MTALVAALLCLLPRNALKGDYITFGGAVFCFLIATIAQIKYAENVEKKQKQSLLNKVVVLFLAAALLVPAAYWILQIVFFHILQIPFMAVAIGLGAVGINPLYFFAFVIGFILYLCAQAAFMTAVSYAMFSLEKKAKTVFKMLALYAAAQALFVGGSYLFYRINPFDVSQFIMDNTRPFHAFFLPALICHAFLLTAMEKFKITAIRPWLLK